MRRLLATLLLTLALAACEEVDHTAHRHPGSTTCPEGGPVWCGIRSVDFGTPTSTPCAEDDPCWNCSTMGNRTCGVKVDYFAARRSWVEDLLAHELPEVHAIFPNRATTRTFATTACPPAGCHINVYLLALRSPLLKGIMEHEIAHVLAYRQEGRLFHDALWRTICRERRGYGC